MLKKLQTLLNTRKYLVRLHARERMIDRNIQFQEIRESLNSGVIIETYQDDRPFPSFLILGFTKNNRPLHSIWALDDKNLAYLISAYDPDPNQWKEYKVRRK